MIDAEELEQLSFQLRNDLRDWGDATVKVNSDDPPPAGARGIGPAGITDIVVTVIATGAAILQILQTVQGWRSVDSRRQGMVLAVEIGPATGSGDPARDRSSIKRGTPPARSALIIANSQYKDPALSQLRSPGADAAALAEVLSRPDIGGFDVDLLVEADERTLKRRLTAFFDNRRHDDLLLVHFSCHGLKSSDGQLYLAAADTELKHLVATALPASFLSGEISRTASRKVVLILDCCYSGAFSRGSRRPVLHGTLIQPHFGDDEGTGQTVLTASSATEYAIDGNTVASGQVTPSIFTSALVEGLRTGQADLDRDGDISIDELFNYAFVKVKRAGSLQQPKKWNYGVSGEVIVAKNPLLLHANYVRREKTPEPTPLRQPLPAPPRFPPPPAVTEGFWSAVGRVRTFAGVGNTSLTRLLQLVDDTVRLHQISNSRTYPTDWQRQVDKWRWKVAAANASTDVLPMVRLDPLTHAEILEQLTTLTGQIETLSSIHIPLHEFRDRAEEK